MQDFSFSDTVDIDEIIIDSHNSVPHQTSLRSLTNDGDNGYDEERQSLLLAVSHDNKALRACVSSLQDQVRRG